jgi:hypothetical protein
MRTKELSDRLTSIAEKVDLILRALQTTTGRLYQIEGRLSKVESLVRDLGQHESRAADRMADRLIQMSMSLGGDPRAAASHRQQARLDETVPSNGDLWGEQENDWPPKGHETMELP